MTRDKASRRHYPGGMRTNESGVIARSRQHLRLAGMGYRAHMIRAGSVGLRMIGGGAAALVHAVVPGLFTWTASRTVRTLDARLTATRRRGGADPLGDDR